MVVQSSFRFISPLEVYDPVLKCSGCGPLGPLVAGCAPEARLPLGPILGISALFALLSTSLLSELPLSRRSFDEALGSVTLVVECFLCHAVA